MLRSASTSKLKHPDESFLGVCRGHGPSQLESGIRTSRSKPSSFVASAC